MTASTLLYCTISSCVSPDHVLFCYLLVMLCCVDLCVTDRDSLCYWRWWVCEMLHKHNIINKNLMSHTDSRASRALPLVFQHTHTHTHCFIKTYNVNIVQYYCRILFSDNFPFYRWLHEINKQQEAELLSEHLSENWNHIHPPNHDIVCAYLTAYMQSATGRNSITLE